MSTQFQASPRLFIGGLKRNVEKEELMEEFKEFGEVVDLWIAYDPPGFAFIQYTNKESAKAAMEAKDKTVMFGGEIRVEFTRKRDDLKEDDEQMGTSKPRVFVGNIMEKVNVVSLNSAFEEYGEITDIHINNTEGFAFIGFETTESAERAVEETNANGTELFGGLLNVVLSYKRNNSPPHTYDEKQTTRPDSAHSTNPRAESGHCQSSRLFVGDLSRDVTKDEISAVFSDYGEIKEIWVPFGFKGYCFVEYEDAESAKLAVDGMNGSEHDFSKGLKVETTVRQRKPEKHQPNFTTPRLFIGNINEELDKPTFRPVFEPYGVITDLWIAFNPPGIAFVEYEDMESALKAIAALDGKAMFGGKLKVALTNSKTPSSKYKFPPGPGRSHPYEMPARGRGRDRGAGAAGGAGRDRGAGAGPSPSCSNSSCFQVCVK